MTANDRRALLAWCLVGAGTVLLATAPAIFTGRTLLGLVLCVAAVPALVAWAFEGDRR